MLNIIDNVIAFVLTKTTPYETIRHSAFTLLTADEIMIRVDPSTANETRDLLGNRTGTLNFSFYAKSKDQAKAETQLHTIRGILDLAEMTEISDGTFIKIEIVTEPMFVQKTDSGEFVFTNGYALEYEKGRA